MTPREEYTARREARRTSSSLLEPDDLRFANLRLLAAAGWLVAAGLAWKFGLPGLGLLVGTIGLFAILVFFHGRILRRRRRCERGALFYSRGLARIDGTWPGQGEPGTRFADSAHLYSDDLDLFGRGSLFERLCSARTRAGESLLARWLLDRTDPSEARSRQAAVQELRPDLGLREELFLLGDEVKRAADSDALAGWARSAPVITSRALPRFAVLIAILEAAGLALWWSGFGVTPFVAAFVLRALFLLLVGRRMAASIADVEGRARDLELLGQLFALVESRRFTSPRLAALRASLEATGVPPSIRLAKLGALLSLLDARANIFTAIPYHLFLVGEITACAIERWRADCGPYVAGWLALLGEFEALASLAGYAWERPGDAMPEFADAGPVFDAAALGHPLLPDPKCVRNDLKLGEGLQVFIVSGSNMSGKSTLLRSVGVATVLAFAGAPVCATRLRLSALATGASVRRIDSLLEGTSRFYAEITRLRDLTKLAEGKVPLLFLVDEILSGTNSHDRAIGAEAVVRGFAKRGAIGLVTTHDLSLAKVADALAPQAANVHFEDHLENGRISFDYLLRPGVVTKSNAIELMRSIGLDV